MNIVTMGKISKYFSVNNVQALDNMDLSIRKGEIHAIVGENGAGKSTLMKILHRIEDYDSGEMKIHGNTGMVSQHFHLINNFSIMENIIIGSEPVKYKILLDRTRAKKKIESILDKFKFKLDLSTKVKYLSVGQKQLVEIIKVIFNNSDILIFDEPTAALSDNEAEKLRKTILSLKKNGKTIIIISHKIADIASVSDRFTIMRKGKFVETVNTADVNLDEISKHMSGSEVVKTVIDTSNTVGTLLFSYEHNNVSFKVHQKEIVAITGYGGCGMDKLERTLEQASLRDINIGYSPSDRLQKGVEINSRLKETLTAKKRREFTHFGFIKKKMVTSFSKKLIDKFDIVGSPNSLTGTLSGGNMQKAVLARVLDEKPEVIVLSSPTWGVDIESTNNIYREIKKFKNRGHGILLLSYDIEEVLKLANRILVMYKGKIIKEIVNNGQLSTHDIGKLSSGINNG